MRRREFIAGLGSAAAWPVVGAWAQLTGKPPKIPRVGILWHAASAEQEDVGVVRQAFNDLGYFEGNNIELDHRFPAEQPDRFRTLARELIEKNVDAIIAVTSLGATALSELTKTIPIVFVLISDPVGGGFVDSLARPGRNMTGLSLMSIDLSGKRLALLKEALPKLSSVAIVSDSSDPFSLRFITSYRASAEALGLSVLPVGVTAPDKIELAFATIAHNRCEGVVIATGAMLFNERARIGPAVLAEKLPTIVPVAEMVPYGPLLSYGQDFPDFFRRAVGYVDKIIRGARPADLPVEQPTRFKFVINLKAAKALGIDVPPTLLARADEVIE